MKNTSNRIVNDKKIKMTLHNFQQKVFSNLKNTNSNKIIKNKMMTPDSG